MITLKQTEQASHTNAYIGLIEDVANVSAEAVTMVKRECDGFKTCYDIAINGEVIGSVFSKIGSNYRPFGSTLQVRLNDTTKWFTQTVNEDKPQKTSSRSRIEVIYSLVNKFYN